MSSVPGGGGFLSNLSGLLSSAQASPNMGLAMGLLQSAGASRLPVTMGAALANGLAQSKAYQAQSLQNAMSQLMLGYKGGLLNAMGFGQPQTTQPPQALQVPTATQAPSVPPTQSANTPTPNLLAGAPVSLPGLAGAVSIPQLAPQQAPQIPASSLGAGAAIMAAAAQNQQDQQNQNNQREPQQRAAPQPQGLFSNMPPDQRIAMDAALFQDPGRLAQAMYENNPMVKAQASDLNQDMLMARASTSPLQQQLWVQKAYQDAGAMQHTFGGVANVLGMGPGGSLVFGKPPEATIMRNGKVELAPGSLAAIQATEAAHAIGQTFGHPVPTVNAVTGATTGYTSAGRAMGYGAPFEASGTPPIAPGTQTGGAPSPQSGVPIFKIGPAQAQGQEVLGKQATEQLTTAIDDQQSAQQQIAQLGELTANLDALNTSASKPAKVEIERLVNGIGTTLGMKPFNLDLTNTQAAEKTIINFTQSATRALGAREPFQAIQFIEKSLPSIKNTPDANQVVSGMLRGLAEYANARGSAAQAWQSKYGSGYVPGVGTFQGTWQKQASPLAFMMDAFPTFEQQAIVKASQTNATLRYELQQAAKSKAAMVQAGYWPSDENQ